MKILVASKFKEKLLKTHPISSKIEGWFFKVDEPYNNHFVVEAIDSFGRNISKSGNDPDILQKEIENIIFTDFKDFK